MKKLRIRFIALAAFGFIFSAASFAQDNPAIGLWKLTDEGVTTFFRTYEEGGVLKAKVEKKVLKDGSEDPQVICTVCKDAMANSPLYGLLVIWDMKPDGGMKYKGGKLLHLGNGKTYNGRVEAVPGGKILKVTGSVAFMSKTDNWERVE